MARTKAFDDDWVLEQAMRAFWAGGYAATSVQDLEHATGLGRGSLYNAFGDKEQLLVIHNMGQGCRSSTATARATAPGSPRR